MKQRITGLILVFSMLLSGCSWMGGSYISVTPHQQENSGAQSGSLTASNYSQLRSLLAELAQNGTESAVIQVSEYDRTKVEKGMEDGVRYISEILPIGAYAIDKVEYEIGVSGGQPAISVNISYLHGRSELRKIRLADNMEDAQEIITDALEDCDDSVVIYVEEYSNVDLVQLVADYAVKNPNLVMEIPELAIGAYPEQGPSRVLELKFTYQTSRDSLRSMQTQVKRVFASAALYVNQNDADGQKFAQLYAFLMERFDYQIETSITPSYSLLCHGVGDGKTFAMVYAAMCRSAGLDCRMVTGTKDGEAWYWNLICQDGTYYHVDLLGSRESGQLIPLTDGEMSGYVWDYSAYPATGVPADPTEATE